MTEKEMYNIIGKNIKKYRNELKETEKLTQERLAELVGVSASLIRNLESNKIAQGISIDTLYKISIVLNKNISDFLKENKDGIISDEEIKLILNNNVQDEELINKLYKIYIKNYNIIKKYINIKRYNKNNFKTLLNKKRVIILFEDINIKRINYYITVWNDLHKDII